MISRNQACALSFQIRCICLHKFDAVSPPVTLYLSTSHVRNTGDGYGDVRNKPLGSDTCRSIGKTLNGNMFKCFVKVALLFSLMDQYLQHQQQQLCISISNII